MLDLYSCASFVVVAEDNLGTEMNKALPAAVAAADLHYLSCFENSGERWR